MFYAILSAQKKISPKIFLGEARRNTMLPGISTFQQNFCFTWFLRFFVSKFPKFWSFLIPVFPWIRLPLSQGVSYFAEPILGWGVSNKTQKTKDKASWGRNVQRRSLLEKTSCLALALGFLSAPLTKILDPLLFSLKKKLQMSHTTKDPNPFCKSTVTLSQLILFHVLTQVFCRKNVHILFCVLGQLAMCCSWLEFGW